MNRMFYRCWREGGDPEDGKVIDHVDPEYAAENYVEQTWGDDDHPDETVVFTRREDKEDDEPQKWTVTAMQDVKFTAREEF